MTRNTLIGERYFIGLSILLGFAPFFSIAALNTFFYLAAASGAVLLILSEKNERKHLCGQIFLHPLFNVLLLWIFLLYVSALYSSGGEHIAQYAEKYKKYGIIFFLVYVQLYYGKRHIKLAHYFFQGLVTGAFTLFVLSIALKISGIGENWVQEGYLDAAKVINNGYWMPIGYFMASLLFGVLFGYGVWLISKRKKVIGWLVAAIGLVMVFIILKQRTGYIGLVVMALWLFASMIESKKTKWALIVLSFVVIVTVMSTENKISVRMNEAFSQASHCISALQSDRENINALGRDCDTSNGIRLIFIHDALRQIASSPLYGHGLGSLDIGLITYGGDGQYHLVRGANAHNEYLMQGVQLGMIGIALLIAIYTLAVRGALQISGSQRYLYAGIILMYIVSCLFNSFLLDAAEGIFLILVVATIIAQNLLESGESRHETDYS